MKNELNQISSCEVCGNHKLIPVLDLGLHPMCDDLVNIGEERECREYPIDILYCDNCITAHQRFQVPKHELFPRSYHYRSRFTADVLSGMASLVESCENRFGSLEGKRILDVGCNDGSLLNFFRDKGAETIGIEPTAACLDAKKQGHIAFNDFLSASLASKLRTDYGCPDFIVFTNVFAHIENLTEVIESLRKLLSSETVIVIENHYLGSILDGNQFDTFYHEHPRTYSYTSFSYIASNLGMKLLDVEFPSRYGGNIRIFIGPEDVKKEQGMTVKSQEIRSREKQFLGRFDLLRKNIDHWCVNKKAFVEELVMKHGKIKAKAFPGRAAILIKLLGLDHTMVSAVYEKPGSMKIGSYLPGTRIPILSDDELFADSDKSQLLLNFAWHIPEEIRSYLVEHGYTGEVIDIVTIDDFV